MLSIVLLFSVGMGPATRPIDREIDEMELKFKAIQQTYGPKYPEWIMAQNAIARLEADRAKGGVADLAPATQPSEPSVRELQGRLATMMSAYGANYPEPVEAMGLERRIAWLEAGGDRTNADTEPASESNRLDSELLHKEVGLNALEAREGEKNPSVVAVKAVVDLLISKGAKVDRAEAKKLLAATVAYRQTLLKTYPIRNPVVVAETRKIDYLSSVAGDNGK